MVIELSSRITVAALSFLLALGFAVNSAYAQDTSEAEETAIDEITVTGMRGSAASMRAAKRNSDNVTDSIFAEDMGKMPDENIAEAMQRITGISIERADGEGTTVTVRGVESSLNQVSMNGVPLTNGGDDNSVDFTNMSADMLRSIEVVKTPSANHDEGSLGGMINLTTFRPLDSKNRSTFTIQQQMDELADESDTTVKAAIVHKFQDDRLGIAVSAYRDERSTRTDYHNLNNWRNYNNVGATSWQTGADLGAITSFEPALNDMGIKFQDRVRTGGAATVEYDISETSSIWLDVSYSMLDQDFLSHQARLTNARADNIWDEDSGTSVVGSSPTTRGNILTRNQETETETTTVGLGYEIDVGDLSFLFNFGSSKSEQEWVKNRRVNFRPAFTPAGYSWIDANGSFYDIPSMAWDTPSGFFDPDAAVLFQIYDDDRTVTDDYQSAAIDVTWHLEAGPIDALEFGAKYFERGKDRSQTTGNTPFSTDDNGNQVFLSDVSMPFPVNDRFAGVADNAYSGWPVPDIDYIHSTYLPDGFAGDINELNTYTTDMDVSAAYVKAVFSAFGDRFLGDFGVRFVDTHVRSIGAQGINFPAGSDPISLVYPVDLTNDYTNTLPSFNGRFLMNEDMMLRFSVAKVMARPKFTDLRPGLVIIATNPTNVRGAGGNPLLSPTEALQYDLSWEWYYGEDGMLSIAAFYKDLDSFIYTQTEDLDIECPPDLPADLCLLLGPTPITNAQNGQGGSVQGIELAFQQQFTFLPGFLSDFGGIFNYTYADSDATYVSPDVPNSELFAGFPFLNTSRDTFNTTLYWEHGGHTVRLAYNYRSESLVQPVQNDGSIWADARQSLDMSGKFRLTDNLSLTFAGTNLTNEPNRRFVTRTIGATGLEPEGSALEGSAPQWRTNQFSHIGRSYRIGLTLSFQ